MNTIKVKYSIPNENILRRIKTTPTLSRLSRINQIVGENIEVVNHKQYSDMVRMYGIFNIEIEKL